MSRLSAATGHCPETVTRPAHRQPIAKRSHRGTRPTRWAQDVSSKQSSAATFVEAVRLRAAVQAFAVMRRDADAVLSDRIRPEGPIGASQVTTFFTNRDDAKGRGRQIVKLEVASRCAESERVRTVS